MPPGVGRRAGVLLSGALAALVMGGVLSGCQGGGGFGLPAGVPGGSSLVGEAETSTGGFLFEAPGGGTVYLLSDGSISATLRVSEGDVVRLNEWGPSAEQPWTRLTINGETRFDARTRGTDHRLYFWPVPHDEPGSGSQTRGDGGGGVSGTGPASALGGG
jgi:hypothetical protein